MAKLEAARKKCVPIMRSKGLSENEISRVESVSYKKAASGYVDNPNIQTALSIYFESLTSEAHKFGYDIS